MTSQLDLDQGGTFRQTIKAYMGPSVGWQSIASTVILAVTTAGTTTVLPGNSIIAVNVNGSVTIQLPLAKGSAAGPQAIPGSFAMVPIVVIDTGGFALANPITIQRAGTELIDGLTSIQITSAYGAFVLQPDVINGGWTLTQ